MTVICPSITAYSSHEYREQLNKIEPFAERIHIDVMDGIFAPTKSINLIQCHWPEKVLTDIHVMYQRPLEHIETLVSLQPNLVIIHAESDGDLQGMIDHLHKFSIKVGVALLQDTKVLDVQELIMMSDHVLIFSGNLGKHGGTADLSLMTKVQEIRSINPNTEISWDGGVSISNALELARGGIEVLNVGGAIHMNDNPIKAYETLIQLVN